MVVVGAFFPPAARRLLSPPSFFPIDRPPCSYVHVRRSVLADQNQPNPAGYTHPNIRDIFSATNYKYRGDGWMDHQRKYREGKKTPRNHFTLQNTQKQIMLRLFCYSFLPRPPHTVASALERRARGCLYLSPPPPTPRSCCFGFVQVAYRGESQSIYKEF